MPIEEILLLVGAYALGSIPSAYVVVRMLTGEDIRTTGSGNVGATNAVRAAGKSAGAVVGVLDVLKGVVPVLVARRMGFDPVLVGAAGALAVVGHCFPVWLRFKGGKGVATTGGAFLSLSPLTAGVCMLVWIAAMLVTRMVSASSIIAALAFPIAFWRVGHATGGLLVAATAVSILIIARHHGNIARMIAGTEPRVGSKKELSQRQEEGEE